MTPSVTRLRLAVLSRWNGKQYELAARCAIDCSDLARYLGGNLAMPIHHKAILAHVLGVEPAEIEGWLDGNDLWAKLSA